MSWRSMRFSSSTPDRCRDARWWPGRCGDGCCTPGRHLPRRSLRGRWLIAVLRVVFAGIACLNAPAPRAASAADLSGHWEGAIELPATNLAILVELKQVGDQWSGLIDIPAQGAKGLALAGIAIAGDTLQFRVSGVPGDPAFKGTFAAATGKITGTIVQFGQSLPFHLGREKEAGPARPQEPKPPFPYRAEDVSYKNGDITLAGTLTIPQGKGPFPAALLLSGSGPQNRDEELVGHKPFLVVADFLTRAGIAVLRVDDRGVGGSSGQLIMSTTSDFADDALAGVRFLRARAEVNPKRVGLIGHSEGGLVAPLAASRSKDVAYIVLLAGTGVPGDEVLIRQNELMSRAAGVSEAAIQAGLAGQRAVLDLIKAGADSAALWEKGTELARMQMAALPDSVRPSREMADQMMAAQLGGVTKPWFRFFVGYDPRPALRRVTVPVLVLNGELDLQVSPDQNVPEIEKALKEGGNRDVTVRRLRGLNHLFQQAKTGALREYSAIEETMNPAALETIRDWIVQRFSGQR
jgi:pimeloyl-ACP methyl ester carboxylesterase